MAYVFVLEAVTDGAVTDLASSLLFTLGTDILSCRYLELLLYGLVSLLEIIICLLRYVRISLVLFIPTKKIPE